MRQICVLAALPVFLAAQPAPSTDQAVLQALLTEVRQLRLTLEKSALLGPRVQIALQRIQLQEQKIARLNQQLDDVRKQMGNQSAVQAKLAQDIEIIEQEISRTDDERQRKELGNVRDDFKKRLSLSLLGTPDAQLRQRESEIAGALQSEQSVLNELNDKLNAIERLLEPAK